ncbi:MAG: M3 family oligoendopeptidase [Phycisphaeraceae bacterium]|nr:M3 family oligoendopeptidase [Phycisphaeraceae bacterium]
MSTSPHNAPSPAARPLPFDARDPGAVREHAARLSSRPVVSADDFVRWLEERSDFDAACSEAEANLYIATTRNTEDAESTAAYTRFIETVSPLLKTIGFDLDRKQVALHERFTLDETRYGVISRDAIADVALFREENVPLQTDLAKMSQRYEQIMGAMSVEFEGREQTLPQMARYQERTERELRERAWRAVAERRMRDADALEALFDQMLEKRAALARNAGESSYIGYAFRAKHRFDYTPADCRAFHDSIEKHCVPLVRTLDRERAERLGVGRLRPWDLSVDTLGREPLRPFQTAEELTEKCQRLFDGMGSGLGALFARLREGDCLDLASRKGKAPGGYQYVRDFSREPFIFMNAAGLHGDVRTMIHEAGHAFHSMLSERDPLVHYRHAPIEFAEVASMGMEMLSMPRWREFYPDASDLTRAWRDQLLGVVSILPWIATIDAFQLWIYEHPGHTRRERTDAWLGLMRRFGHEVDWSGLERQLETLWHRQLHIFTVPMYYIEYGIAQLGALQLWRIMLDKGLDAALDGYCRGLALGGSRPLPALFESAGARFDFSSATVERLMAAAREELAKLPE